MCILNFKTSQKLAHNKNKLKIFCQNRQHERYIEINVSKFYNILYINWHSDTWYFLCFCKEFTREKILICDIIVIYDSHYNNKFILV